MWRRRAGHPGSRPGSRRGSRTRPPLSRAAKRPDANPTRPDCRPPGPPTAHVHRRVLAGVEQGDLTRPSGRHLEDGNQPRGRLSVERGLSRLCLQLGGARLPVSSPRRPPRREHLREDGRRADREHDPGLDVDLCELVEQVGHVPHAKKRSGRVLSTAVTRRPRAAGARGCETPVCARQLVPNTLRRRADRVRGKLESFARRPRESRQRTDDRHGIPTGLQFLPQVVCYIRNDLQERGKDGT
jgi:hypothetical protein